MICIPTQIPDELCAIDDELKAIYHSKYSFCIWVFKTRAEHNTFMDDTAGIDKDARVSYYAAHF